MMKLALQTMMILLVLLAVSCGCRSVQHTAFVTSGKPSGVSSELAAVTDAVQFIETDTLHASRWPTRWGNNPDQPGTIIDLDPAESLRPIHLSRFHEFRSSDVEYSDANQLAADIGITIGFKFKPEGPGSFIFIPNPKNESTPDLTKDTGKQSESDLPDLAFKFVSATQTNSEAKNDEDHVELQRTWFIYRDPKKTESSNNPVGTIILLPGMFGTPDVIVDALENYWHHKGYAILRMRSQPSRFTEHLLMDVIAGNEEEVANRSAIVNDDRVAEGAYAVNAALNHLHTLRPILKSQPTILIGMSGGAMMLPTVYAYAPENYSGAVLIAGGAGFLKIAIESNYKSWIDAIVYDFNADKDEPRLASDIGEPTDEQLETLSRVYLQASKLDAYHTATEMIDIPVLMLHGSNDKAVPSSSGQLLYHQLGNPERWTYPVGHELIFMGLPTQVGRIDKWITKNVIDSATD